MNFYTPPGFAGDDYDDEDGLDLFGMPPPYTDDEILAMAAEYEPSPVAAVFQERLQDLRLDQIGARRNFRGFSFRKQRRLLLAAGKSGCVLAELGKQPVTFTSRTEADVAYNEAFARQAAMVKAERERAGKV